MTAIYADLNRAIVLIEAIAKQGSTAAREAHAALLLHRRELAAPPVSAVSTQAIPALAGRPC